MSILTSEERRQAIDILLTQYRDYQRVASKAEKNKISNEMFFVDPIVWILYKYEAYQGSDHAISTWGDLVEHSIGHDGICGRRLKWLSAQCKKEGVDIHNEATIPTNLLLAKVTELSVILNICKNEQAMNEWEKYEYETIDGEVKKWQSYSN